MVQRTHDPDSVAVHLLQVVSLSYNKAHPHTVLDILERHAALRTQNANWSALRRVRPTALAKRPLAGSVRTRALLFTTRLDSLNRLRRFHISRGGHRLSLTTLRAHCLKVHVQVLLRRHQGQVQNGSLFLLLHWTSGSDGRELLQRLLNEILQVAQLALKPVALRRSWVQLILRLWNERLTSWLLVLIWL